MFLCFFFLYRKLCHFVKKNIVSTKYIFCEKKIDKGFIIIIYILAVLPVERNLYPYTICIFRHKYIYKIILMYLVSCFMQFEFTSHYYIYLYKFYVYNNVTLYSNPFTQTHTKQFYDSIFMSELLFYLTFARTKSQYIDLTIAK